MCLQKKKKQQMNTFVLNFEVEAIFIAANALKSNCLLYSERSFSQSDERKNIANDSLK